MLNVKCYDKFNLAEEEYIRKVEKTEKVTLTKVVSQDSYKGNKNELRINILQKIKTVYEKINPIIFYESIIIFILFLILSVKNKEINKEKIILLIGLLGIYFCRIFIISFTSVTMYTEAINVMYLSVTYVIQQLFALIINVFVVQEILKYSKHGKFGCKNLSSCKRNNTNI